MGQLLDFILLIIGIAAITAGGCIIYAPAALMVGGAACVFIALYPGNGKRNNAPKGGA